MQSLSFCLQPLPRGRPIMHSNSKSVDDGMTAQVTHVHQAYSKASRHYCWLHTTNDEHFYWYNVIHLNNYGFLFDYTEAFFLPLKETLLVSYVKMY